EIPHKCGVGPALLHRYRRPMQRNGTNYHPKYRTNVGSGAFCFTAECGPYNTAGTKPPSGSTQHHPKYRTNVGFGAPCATAACDPNNASGTKYHMRGTQHHPKYRTNVGF